MTSTPQINNTTSFKKMIDMFFDKQLAHEDQTNDLIVLGKSYNPNSTQESHETDENEEPKSISSSNLFFSKEESVPWPQDFIQDVGSRIWLTYRTGFPLIPRAIDGPSPITMSIGTFLRSGTMNDFKTGFTTDAGWGCMIRTSQCLLANALIILNQGRDWRWDPNSEDKMHDKIISWFVDVPSAPFSIHNFVIEGSKTGKKAGEWFGPTLASRSIRGLCDVFDCNLKVYITEDGGDVYEDDLFKILKPGDDGVASPILILSALRLGVDNINPVYWESLKKTLAIPQSVGIAGGRERSSHYFFGSQGDYLFYFDPHLPQESLQFKDKDEEFVEIETFNFNTVHTRKLKKLHLKEMDPSMLIGFLIKDEDDYFEWKQVMSEYKLIHFNKFKNFQQLRKPSIIEFDEGFIDLGYEEEDDDFEEREDTTEPVIIEERRFSELVMVDKEDLTSTKTSSSQVLEDSSSIN